MAFIVDPVAVVKRPVVENKSVPDADTKLNFVVVAFVNVELTALNEAKIPIFPFTFVDVTVEKRPIAL